MPFTESKKPPIKPNNRKRTPAQRYADLLASGMGSWSFLIGSILFLMLWITVNLLAWEYGWDPYPFILLNLVLSSIAALQAPIILMSQNRQAERDRINAQYDYQVNRKAEREIRDMQKDLEEIKNLIRKLDR